MHAELMGASDVALDVVGAALASSAAAAAARSRAQGGGGGGGGDSTIPGEYVLCLLPSSSFALVGCDGSVLSSAGARRCGVSVVCARTA